VAAVVPIDLFPGPIDEDKDGVQDTLDKCPAYAGDRINGCPSELGADVRGVWRVNDLFSQLRSLTVRTKIGSRIELTCAGKKRVCGFRKRTIRQTTTRSTSLTRNFGRKRIFPAGTTITVRVTRTLQRGTYEQLLTRRGRRLPRVLNRCLNFENEVHECP